MENNEMNNAMENTGFDPRGTMLTALSAKLVELGIEMSEQAKGSLVDFLIGQKLFDLNKIKNLAGFYHHRVNTDEQLPRYSLLINNLIVYVSTFNEEVHEFMDAYYNHLENEEIYEEDLSYADYLSQNNLTDNMTTVERVNVTSVRLGDLFKDLRRQKTQAEETLVHVSPLLEVVEGLVSENFLKIKKD